MRQIKCYKLPQLIAMSLEKMSMHRIEEEQEFPSGVFSVPNDFVSHTLINKLNR